MTQFATHAEYRDQLVVLLPPGPAWTVEPGSTRHRALEALAAEFARIDARMGDLLEESDPRTTLELLPEWERVAGLPDPCAGQATTIAERRARLVRALTARGGQSRAYFIGVAAALGFAVTIEEFFPFVCVSDCDDSLNPDPWRFVWRVRAPETTVWPFTVGSGCDEPLASWGNAVLECVIWCLAPAHTQVLFAYGSS
ncbi:MAG: DUF2313 domain-containing protein [Tagaea sp.]|nr:DUF2313 domain-containing protein [Tagaea sp.]